MTPNNESALSVRTMRLEDLELVLKWAEAEGWNPGKYDARSFYAADPDGFFLGLVAGEPVACISCVRYGEGYGSLGLFIVRPEYRGRGLGFKVWVHGLAHLSGRNIGLDGVIAQVPNYERSGFRVAHQTIRYAGIGGGVRPEGLVPLSDLRFKQIADYDAACFPQRRDAFLRSWISQPESIALGAIDSDGLTGYCVMRKSAKAYKVGPLFADNAVVATRVLQGIVATIPGEEFVIDIPDGSVQPFSIDIVNRFQLSEVFRTARMYTNGIPDYGVSRVFGVTSLELG